MIVRRWQKRTDQKIFGLPATDWAAYALLGGIIIRGVYIGRYADGNDG